MPAYTLRLGPLSFTAPSDTVSRTLGEALENVGAALVPSERRPRPLKLKVPVEGDPRAEADPKAVGDRLRRQTEQLLENRRWLSQGLYLYWEVGDLLAGWVLLGGGELAEQDPGISFGRYDLELTDLYVVGTTATHRPGRRHDLVDRRDPTIPRDTRGLLYTDDFAATPIVQRRVFLPGAASQIRASSGLKRQIFYGPKRGGPVGADRYLWVAVEAVDGEVITYLHDRLTSDIDPRRAPAVSEDFGAVRAWDTNSDGGDYSFTPLATAGSQDYDPDLHYSWERLYGTPNRSDRFLALENGSVRVRWMGGSLADAGDDDAGGLVLEWWDEGYPGGPRYRPEGRFIHVASDHGGNYGFEVTLIEITPERGVLEVRFGDRCLRVILQRGWVSVRLESYVDQRGSDADRAWLQWTAANPGAGGFEFQPQAPGTEWAWVQGLLTDRDSPDTTRVVNFAPAADTYTYDVGANDLLGDAGCTITQPAGVGPNLVAAQISPPFPITTEQAVEYGLSTVGQLAEIGLTDDRGVPVLVAR